MTRLSAAQQRVVDWMRDGDRALHKCHLDPNWYGYYAERESGHDYGRFRRVCNRKTLDAIIKAGIAEWYKCSPPDLRAMLVLPKSEQQ